MSNNEVERLIEAYVTLREQKKALSDRHKQELEPFDMKMERIEMALQKKLHDVGVDSFKTKAGTAYTSTTVSAKVADWEKVLDFAVENERFDLFERRVNKTVVQEIGAVPGVEIEMIKSVNIRKA